MKKEHWKGLLTGLITIAIIGIAGWAFGYAVSQGMKAGIKESKPSCLTITNVSGDDYSRTVETRTVECPI